MTDFRIMPSLTPLSGTVLLPSDKSISHRALLLAAIAEGKSHIDGRCFGGDNISTMRVLRALGVEIEELHASLVVHGRGLHGLRAPTVDLDCGNSGTTMRLLAGLLAGQSFAFRLTGDASLLKRPMRRLLDPLTARGARLSGMTSARADEITGPIVGAFPASQATVRNARNALSPLTWDLQIASAQVKSALLLSGLYATGNTDISEPQPSRDHTERMLRALGVPVTCGSRLVLHREGFPGILPAFELAVPGDLSAAAFFLAAALAVEGSELTLENVGINPTRTGILAWMQNARVWVGQNDVGERSGEPIATLSVAYGQGQATALSGALLVRAIDEVPAICAIAAGLSGTTVISDAAELRTKESDRLLSCGSVLRAYGIDVEERPDGLSILGKPEGKLRACTVDSHGDHRIAMMAAILALRADGPCVVRDVDCVQTSFPRFAETLRSVGARIA